MMKNIEKLLCQMKESDKGQQTKYKVVLVESDQPNSYSGKVDVCRENQNVVCFSVYNNVNLYRLLTRAIDKYFS